MVAINPNPVDLVLAFVPFGARVAFVAACAFVVLLAAVIDRGD